MAKQRSLTAALLALGLAAGAGLAAGEASPSAKAAMRSYMYIKEDTDRYVGEGVAALADFGGDQAKALAAAKERARGDLASNVRVQISSDTTEKLGSSGGQASEDIHSETRSHADLALENVRTMDFKDFPEAGQVTVLASLDKEDYRRQLSGKAVKVYRPEAGFRLGGGLALPSTDDLHGDQDQHPGGDPAGAELDVLWRSFYFGFQIAFDVTGTSDKGEPKPYSISAINLGYDWAPWAWRVQPFVPLQLQYAYWDMDPSFAQTFSASAGLGVRFWANDTVALQLQGAWNQGLAGGDIYQSGGNLLTVNGHQAHVAMTGPSFGAGITWSGF
jgi:hypothetical protein